MVSPFRSEMCQEFIFSGSYTVLPNAVYDYNIKCCNLILFLCPFQYWDYKGGYEMPTQYKSGYTVFGIAGALSLFLAAYAYTL